MRQLVFYFAILYTLINTVVSQLNFIFDTRYTARKFLLENYNDLSYTYYTYSNISGMPRNVSLKGELAEIVVLHEGYYRKYWKSFTTPFIIPKCCDEVYFCEDKEECKTVQNILANNSEYQLIKKFTTIDLIPEKVLFKMIYGTYEEFIGDVLIYKRTRHTVGN